MFVNCRAVELTEPVRIVRAICLLQYKAEGEWQVQRLLFIGLFALGTAFYAGLLMAAFEMADSQTYSVVTDNGEP
jgi:hypothetical protein